ncbi:MAG: flavin reductase family protein [Rhodoglobus sp.]|nr:flavin reductase family protein [Rhodoglobus sp.]
MDTAAPDSSAGREAFLQAFRRHAAGVAAVTSRAPDGQPVGFTATSLASLAAAPPLATFNMARISSAWPAMTIGNHVAIHMLGARSKRHADRMAADNALRFDGEHWKTGPHELPILDGVTAFMVGRIVSVLPVNENAVIVVEIEGGDQGEDDDALLYYGRRYHRPGDVI